MRIIDAHLHFIPGLRHFSRLASRAGYENTAESLKAAFDAQGIIGGLVMGNNGCAPENYHYPDFLLYLVGVTAENLLGDPAAVRRNLDGIEANLRREDCRGIKLYPGYSYHYIYEPIYGPVYELAKAYKKPVAVHTGQTARPDALLKYSHPLTLDDAAVLYPDVQFIMCHMGNPFLAEAAAVLEKNRNVAADLSGLLDGRISVPEYLSRMSGYVEMLRSWIAYVEDYSRFLFGTDWPLANYGEYVSLVQAVIPEKHQDAVFCGNAERIYGLEGRFS